MHIAKQPIGIVIEARFARRQRLTACRAVRNIRQQPHQPRHPQLEICQRHPRLLHRGLLQHRASVEIPSPADRGRAAPVPAPRHTGSEPSCAHGPQAHSGDRTISNWSSRTRSCRGFSAKNARATVIGSRAPPNRFRDFTADFATPLILPKSRVKKLTTRSASCTGQVRRTTASEVSTAHAIPSSHLLARHRKTRQSQNCFTSTRLQGSMLRFRSRLPAASARSTSFFVAQAASRSARVCSMFGGSGLPMLSQTATALP